MYMDSLGSDAFSRAARLGRQVTDNQLSISRTVERLSSGLRVNRVSDDPSGSLRINSLQADLYSQRQAIENTQEASILGATALEGAQRILLQLERMREIATLSLDKSTSEIDRDKLQKELGTLSTEIDRIARSTEYNGRYLLDGSSTSGQASRAASSRTLVNNTLTDAVSGQRSSFLSQVDLDADADGDALFEFRLFNAPGRSYTSLEVSASSQGIIRSYDYYLDSPASLSLPLSGLGGAGLNVQRSVFQDPARTPLSNAELNTPLQALANQGRIDQVSYGNLALTAGGQVFASVINVTATTTLNDVITAIDNLSGPNGAFNASYSSGTGRITVGFTGSQQATAVSNTSYTPAVPAAAGGPFDAFALITPAPDGPAYRNPDSFLPAVGFAVGSAQSYFPTLPGSLSADLSLSGSNASLLSVFGLGNQSGRGNVSSYNTSYSGETVATGGQSEYINRTRLTIDDVTAQQSQTGSHTGLSAADADETFRVLNTAVIDAPAFGAGDFTIDFGNNGILTFAGFNPAVDGIDEIVNAVNAFKPGFVSASFDAGTDLLTINNTPEPAAVNAKATDPGLGAGGSFAIDFGSNGTFNFNLQPGSSTIQSFVTALNAQSGVSASFDATTDQLTLNNTVSPVYDTKIANPGFGTGTFSIDFGLNGTLSLAATNGNLSINDVINGINNYTGEFLGGSVSASWDNVNDRLTINNSVLIVGNNQITVNDGGTGLKSALKLTNVASTGIGANQLVGTNIDQAGNPLLNIDEAGGDLNRSLQSLATTQVYLSGGTDNRIDFSSGLGERVRDFFKLNEPVDNSPNLTGTYTQTASSSAAIDNGGAGSPYDITASDVTSATFQSLTTPFPTGPYNNQIVFGGVNAANIRNVFNLNDVASNGLASARTSSSTSAIDRGDLDSSLELSPAQVSGDSLTQLLTPRLSTLVTGPLVIDGNTVININPDTTTLNQVIGAINSYSGSSNKTYSAAFSSGRLSLTVTDRETLLPSGSAPAANPNEATPRLSGNALVFDSSAYVARTAPKTVGGVALNPAGTGPAEQTLGTGTLDSRYNILNPVAPGNISSISWGGTTNLASVLSLVDVGSGNVSGPTLIQDEYQGVISSTGANSYNLQATNRRSFEASSATSSSQVIGRNKDRVADDELGVIARVQVFAEEDSRPEKSLVFQVGSDAGDTIQFGFGDLTSRALRVETLNLVGENTEQTRRRSINTLNVVERAIEKTLTQTSRLGAFQLSIDGQSDSLAVRREALTSSLEAWQNTDIARDIRELGRQQLVAQTGNIALSQNFSNTQRLYGALFEALPGGPDFDEDDNQGINPATFAEERRRELQERTDQALAAQLARAQSSAKEAEKIYGLTAENQI